MAVRSVPQLDFETVAVELLTTVFIIGVLFRAGAQQLSHIVLYREHPECRPALDEVVRTDIAIQDEIDPADVPVYRLAPAAFCFLFAGIYAIHPMTLTGHSLPVMLGVVWMLSNLAFAVAWDPLVWIVEGVRR